MHDIAGQWADGVGDFELGESIHVATGGDAQVLALAVVCDGRSAEPNRCDVGFVFADQKSKQLGGAVHADHEKAGGHRV